MNRYDARRAIEEFGQSHSVWEAILLTIARQYAEGSLLHISEVENVLHAYRQEMAQ